MVPRVHSEIFNITDLFFLRRKCLDINYCQQEINNASMRIKKKEMRGILMFLPKKNTIQIVISYTGLATITVSVSNKKKIT
jgi:hypothetical protein